MHGGYGDDLVRGSGGSDFLFGMAGNDRIYGYGGDDFLADVVGSDHLYAGSGSDDIIAADSFATSANGDWVYGGALGLDICTHDVYDHVYDCER
jgi:serralysin